MKTSVNNKKSILLDKPQSAKKPTVVKCFICNQMFYSQQSFDFHMDQHQKKVNKNFPDQIQRKTMESFGLKRNSSINKKISTLQAINQNQIKDKNLLNKTLKYPLHLPQSTQNNSEMKLNQTKSAIMKKPIKKIDEIGKKKQQRKQSSQSPSKMEMSPEKQIEQIDYALKQSSLLMSQMTFFITQKQDNLEIQADQAESNNQSDQQDQEKQIQRTVSEHQFTQQLKNNNWSLNKIEEQILKTNFTSHKSLQNCQIQIEYLRKLYHLSSDQRTLEKINKTKSKIVAQFIKYIMEEQKYNFIAEPSRMKSEQTKQQENHEARTCSECADMIAFGQICIIQGELFFHKECFHQKDRSLL